MKTLCHVALTDDITLRMQRNMLRMQRNMGKTIFISNEAREFLYSKFDVGFVAYRAQLNSRLGESLRDVKETR
jgi:hypothetical protein